MHRFERWRGLILQARDQDTLDRLMREYAACIMPSEAAKLPQAVQEVLAAPDADLAANAVTIAHEELRYAGDADSAALLNEIAQTFIAASNRMAQIDRSVPLRDPPNRP